jgi:hypothetical protein
MQGEISQLLEREGGKKYDIRYINGQISVLRNVGLFAPPSNARCLIYPKELLGLKTDKKKVGMCLEQGTYSSWSSLNNDWVTDYLPTNQESVISNPVKEVIVPDNDFEFDIDSGTFSS